MLDALERDCAVGISIGNYLSSFRIGGHAITLWGYLHDTSASPYSKEAYPAIFISDSDSDKYDGALRRQAPNRLRVMMMDGMFDGFGADSWELDYPSTFPWRLESFYRSGALPRRAGAGRLRYPQQKTPRRIFPFRICTSALPRLMIWSLALIRSLPTSPSKSAGSR